MLQFLLYKSVLTIILCVAVCSTLAFADDNSDKISADVTAEKAKAMVLKWIDDYRQDQVLFHDEDIARLREDLAQDTPEEAMRWWSETARMRAALESPQWQETRKWLSEFLRVQAIFSDEEVDEFRTKAKAAATEKTAHDFEQILAKVENYRANLIQGAASDKSLRDHKLKVLEAFQKEEAAQRTEAAKAAAFGTTKPSQPAVQPRAPRYPPAPLIDSLDVARWSVMRNFWRW